MAGYSKRQIRAINGLLDKDLDAEFDGAIWLGAIYMPKDSADEIERWQLTAQGVSGLNVNLTDAQRPSQAKNTVASWKSAIASYSKGKDNAMKPIPRTTFSYPGNDRGTIEERLTTIFKDELKFGYKIEWLMLYANKLGENAELDTITFSQEEMQTIRDWLEPSCQWQPLLCTSHVERPQQCSRRTPKSG